MFKVVQELPDGAQVARLREKMGLSQTELAELFGVSLRQWQRKESVKSQLASNTAPMKVGEANFLLLLANEHPYYQLQEYHPDDVVITAPYDAEEVRQLRIETGMTQKDIAAMLGYKLASWKSKESALNEGTLKPGEFNFLMLLAGVHPKLKLIEK
ncbi:helix-turn-helix domain-containing protein [Rouxiella badensis]|jgi:transcriptional regulator with XRE-family HTH domain|uniref:helix-turn-helix domain-containing protein n=1 Tax=Rouxiella badensis TaxID=1646377 RepID=UPI0017888094|nr:helix-turn-helix domain-containing protein [Rouxiella badensis]QOI57940.1 helix-turn-helix domain-containing protein [Rouxiella badensis subsp. acadiensis]